MKWKNRFTNYNFWISLISAVLLIIRAFDFKFDIGNINEIATAVLGLLVVVGIISDPTKSNSTEVQSKEKAEQKQATKQDDQLPNEGKDENLANSFQNDFKVLVEKITMDIDEKLKKMDNFVPIKSSSVEEDEAKTFLEDESMEKTNKDDKVVEETNEEDAEIVDLAVNAMEGTINQDVEAEIKEPTEMEYKQSDCNNKVGNSLENLNAEFTNKEEGKKVDTANNNDPICFNIVN